MQPLDLKTILGLSDVRRWHTVHTLREQTVADHSARVAALALLIGSPELTIVQQFQALYWGLAHDAHETVYGDIPNPAKTLMERANIGLDRRCQVMFWGEHGGFPEIDPLVLDLVAIVDRLDAALFCGSAAPGIAAEIAHDAQILALMLLTGNARAGMLQRAVEIVWGVLR